MFGKYLFSLIIGALFLVFTADSAFAVSILGSENVNTVAGNIVASTSQLPGLLAALAYLSGLLFAVSGIVKLMEHVTTSNTSSNYVFPRVPIIRFLIGGALFSLPIIVEAVVTMINGGTATIFDPTTEAITVLNQYFTSINTILTFATNLNGVMDNIIRSSDHIPGLISAVSYLLALVIAVSALYKTRDYVEEPSRYFLKDVVIRYVLAGALLALPTIYLAMYNTIADGGLGTGGTIASFVSGFSFFFSSETSSPECASASLGVVSSILLGGSGSLGTVICNTFANTSGLPLFLTSVSYVIGLILGVWGLFKIRDHVVDPSRTGLNEGVMRLIAGGAFFAFPYLTVVVRATVLPDPLVLLTTVTTNTGFNQSGVGCSTLGSLVGLGPSLDQAMGCFVDDLLGPTQVVLNFFATVAGMIFVMIGISRLIKSSQEGARGPGGIGTLTTFIVGGVLLSGTTILRAVSSSMFGNPITQTYANLTYTVGMSAAETQAAHNVISAVLKFMIIIGMISFVRGVFIMRDVAEGKQQASTMAGITHIIGGALAVNLGPLLNAVQNTLGITGFGVTFGI